MKFLIDQPVSPLLAAWLNSSEAGGHDAVHVREEGFRAHPTPLSSRWQPPRAA